MSRGSQAGEGGALRITSPRAQSHSMICPWAFPSATSSVDFFDFLDLGESKGCVGSGFAQTTREDIATHFVSDDDNVAAPHATAVSSEARCPGGVYLRR